MNSAVGAKSADSARAERTLFNKWFRVMGGWGLIRFVHACSLEEAEAVASRAMAEAERIERKYSRYLDTSLISRINRNAGRTPVPVDQETLYLVEWSLRLARATDGAFDPTVGVLRRAWDFREARVPAPYAIRELLPLVDYRQIQIRVGTIFLRQKGMELDLGGIGKEYAVDRVAESLHRDGVESAIVNLAGDVRCVGARGDGRPWKVGVKDPRNKEKCRFSVRLSWDGGIASSGDYERFFIREGVRYHHILDARTGWPARGIASATAVAPTAMEAGVAVTAAFLLGPDRGLKYLESMPGIEGALITEQGDLIASSNMIRFSDLPGSFFARYPEV